MNESYNLNSILGAIEENHARPKKKTAPETKKIIPELIIPQLESNEILPITEQIIEQAEQYTKKNTQTFIKKNSSLEDVLILDREYSEQNSKIVDLEEVKLNIIDDLYSTLSKKVEKKTLKTIFDLRTKINTLEDEVRILNSTTIGEDYDSSNNHNDEEDKEHLINEESLRPNQEQIINNEALNKNEEQVFNKVNTPLIRDVIETLKLQESLIKSFEKNEEKLRLKIVDLEQDIGLFNTRKINTVSTSTDHEINNNFEGKIKELNSKYNLLLEEKENELSKIKSNKNQDTILYKENYEELIVENHDIKKKLKNAKNQIIIYEKNIEELELAFENLNTALSKNSIIKLDQPTKTSGSNIVSVAKNLNKSKITKIQTKKD